MVTTEGAIGKDVTIDAEERLKKAVYELKYDTEKQSNISMKQLAEKIGSMTKVMTMHQSEEFSSKVNPSAIFVDTNVFSMTSALKSRASQYINFLLASALYMYDGQVEDQYYITYSHLTSVHSH